MPACVTATAHLREMGVRIRQQLARLGAAARHGCAWRWR
jgi:hypothetical protein